MKDILETIGGFLVIALFPLLLLSIWCGGFFWKLAATDFVLISFLVLSFKVHESLND